jgi:hypothetical protein
LYQVYVHHLVFGAGALAYIGKAQDQTFADRFSQHQENWLKWESDVAIRLGRLASGFYRTEEEWADLLTDAEKLTIYWHTPPYNAHHITEYLGAPLRIQNWGARGSLLPEYSDPTEWRPHRPDDKCES